MKILFDNCKTLEKIEIHQDNARWDTDEALVEHAEKHVTKSKDEIEKKIFLDCSNKMLSEEERIDSSVFSNAEKAKILYDKLSKETIKSAKHFYLSKNSKGISIAFPGSIDYSKYSSFTKYKRKLYTPYIISSYPTYISDNYWIVPSFYKSILCKNNALTNKYNAHVASEECIEEWLSDRIDYCIEFARTVLKKNYTSKRDILNGALFKYCECKQHSSNVNLMYDDINEQIKKSTDYKIYNNPDSFFNNENINGIGSIGFKLDTYAEKVNLLYVLEMLGDSLYTEINFDGIPLTEFRRMLATNKTPDKKKVIKIEMILLTRWLDSMLDKFDKRYLSLLNAKRTEYFEITNFMLVDCLNSIYQGLYLLKLYAGRTGVELYDRKLGYDEFVKDYKKYIDEVEKTATKDRNLKCWLEMFKEVFDIKPL